MQQQRSLRHGQRTAQMRARHQHCRVATPSLLVLLSLLLQATQHAGAQFLPAVDTGVQRAVSHADAARDVLHLLQLPGTSLLQAHVDGNFSCRSQEMRSTAAPRLPANAESMMSDPASAATCRQRRGAQFATAAPTSATSARPSASATPGTTWPRGGCATPPPPPGHAPAASPAPAAPPPVGTPARQLKPDAMCLLIRGVPSVHGVTAGSKQRTKVLSLHS